MALPECGTAADMESIDYEDNSHAITGAYIVYVPLVFPYTYTYRKQAYHEECTD